MNKIKILAVSLFAVFYFGCGGNSNEEPLDNPTQGHIKISVDESYQPIIDTQISTFESMYKYAKITPSYVSENKAMEDLLNDSARIIVISRQLNAKEKKYFDDIKIIPTVTKIAYDAVSLIINNSNTDSLLTSDQVRKIFSGEITNWKQLGGKSGNKSNIQLVFDNNGSGNVRFMKEFCNGHELAKNSFAVNSNEAVVGYVTKNRNAIGVIGVNWISDEHDSTSNSFFSKIRVMEIAPDDTARGAGIYYKPYQAYIAQRYYPLWRTVYVVSREARAGLGLGFTSFVAGEKGQRIILRSGLVPASMPIRLVEVKQQNINVIK